VEEARVFDVVVVFAVGIGFVADQESDVSLDEGGHYRADCAGMRWGKIDAVDGGGGVFLSECDGHYPGAAANFEDSRR
jgi:hypothetical protein